MLPSSHVYSSLLGYIAVGTCTAISLPQMWSHWRQKKAEGISMTMLWLWLIGDLFGLAGTLVQGLLRTQIILGVINAIVDASIIWQCFYYNKFAQLHRIPVVWRRLVTAVSSKATSTIPWASMPPSDSDPEKAQVQAQQQSSDPEHQTQTQKRDQDLALQKTKTTTTAHRSLTIATIPPAASFNLSTITANNNSEKRKKRLSIIYHLIFIALVVGISIMVWGVVVARVRKTATLKDGEDGTDPKYSSAGAAFGWISMVIYTSSRYPQIYKNWRSKTCSGLSIWVFILLLIYNHTYIASIVIKSQTHSYLIVNMPWIVNCVYNILLDFLILGQFFMYRKNTRRVAEVNETAATETAVP